MDCKNKIAVGYGGLGNRVNELVNGAPSSGRSVLNWQVNQHMPFPFRWIFKDDLGFDVCNYFSGDVGHMDAERHWGCVCDEDAYSTYWYPQNGVISSIDVLKQNYDRILNSFKAKPDTRTFPMAAHWRGLGEASGSLGDFVHHVIEIWGGIETEPTDSLFLMSDSRRGEIKEILDSHKIPYVEGLGNELSNDLDRISLLEMRFFMSNFLTLNKIPVIVTSSSKSSITDPARARGSVIYHVGPLRSDNMCWFVTNQPETFLQL